MAAFVESIPGMRRVFYGWWIVAVGFTIAILNGAFYTYGFGVYFVPLLNELGGSRAALGAVIGLARLEGGLLAPLAGWVIDKYGPRRLLYFGVITMGLAFFLLSRITAMWMLYAVFLLISTASSLEGDGPSTLPLPTGSSVSVPGPLGYCWPASAWEAAQSCLWPGSRRRMAGGLPPS